MAILKMRDVRDNIKELGFDKGIVKTLESLIDELIGHRQAVREMASQQERMIEALSNIVASSGVMKQQLETIKRNEDKFEGLEK